MSNDADMITRRSIEAAFQLDGWNVKTQIKMKFLTKFFSFQEENLAGWQAMIFWVFKPVGSKSNFFGGNFDASKTMSEV